MIVKSSLGFILFGIVGLAMIWLQLKGKRVQVDTETRIIHFSGEKYKMDTPEKIFMNRIRISQNVNSRAQSTNVKTYFYKAYLQDGDEKILLSSNKAEGRDLEKLKAIARDLGIDFTLNY